MARRSPLWVALALAATAGVTLRVLGSGAAPAGSQREVVRPTPAGTPLVVGVRAEGEPRAGVTLRVRGKRNTTPVLVATTDAAGLARFDGAAREDLVVEALGEGFEPTSTEEQGFIEDDGVLFLSLFAGTPLHAIVTEAETGRGIPGARLMLILGGRFFDLGATGSDGTFVVPGLRNPTAELVVTAPGRQATREFLDPRGSSVFPLVGALAVEGVVVDADGRPVAGAEVRGSSLLAFVDRIAREIRIVDASKGTASVQTATTDGRPLEVSLDRLEREMDPPAFGDDLLTPRASTDVRGVFRIDGLPPRVGSSLGVRARGFVASRTTVVRIEGEAPVPTRFTLRRAALVRLRVAAAGDRPLTAKLQARLFVDSRPTAPEVSASPGEFLFSEVEPGPVTAIAVAEGFRSALVDGVAAAGKETALALTLVPRGTITGAVFDPEGRPLVDARLRLEPEEGGEVETASDAQGRFEFRDPQAGRAD